MFKLFKELANFLLGETRVEKERMSTVKPDREIFMKKFKGPCGYDVEVYLLMCYDGMYFTCGFKYVCKIGEYIIRTSNEAEADTAFFARCKACRYAH